MSDTSIDQTLAQEGQKRIDWASSSMPLTHVFARELEVAGKLKGASIGIGLPLDAKLANLALSLLACGAHVSCWSPAHLASTPVVHALRCKKLPVFTSKHQEIKNDPSSAGAFLSSVFHHFAILFLLNLYV